MKCALILLSLLFCFSPLLAESAGLSISREELETALKLTGSSGLLIDDSQIILSNIDQSIGSIEISTSNLNLIMENYKIILSQSQETSDQLGENLDDSESILTDLNTTTENLKPSFWGSRIGVVLKWTGIVAGSFSIGYLTGSLF